jgi:DNA-directed RNA polymerase specialized sigma24 family protein
MHEQSMDPRPGVLVDDAEYVRLRRRLVIYFERRGCHSADNLADDCFQRLVVTTQSKGQPGSVRKYLFGIAGNVYLEHMRSPGRLLEELPDNLAIGLDTPAAETSRGIAREVVAKLSAEERDLMEAHYLDKVSWKAMAGGIGLTEVGLRVKVMRIRNRLMREFDQLNSIGMKRKPNAQSDTGTGL